MKREQGIRTGEDHTEDIKDAITDIIIYLCDFATVENIDLAQVLMQTWKEVKKRDWKAYPKTGVE